MAPASAEQPTSSETLSSTLRTTRRPKRLTLYIIGGVVLLAAIGVGLYLLLRHDLTGQIVFPYIAHQRPAVDPHLPTTTSLADKLDEIQFDGIFNLVATPSGVVYEDGLGELVDVNADNVVTIRLKPNRRWHDTYQIRTDKDEINITRGPDHFFLARDLAFTLRRLQALGSLSPDYILVSQAVNPLVFEGPDDKGLIRLKFRGDRIWKESDIKEVLSFKILPDGSDVNALNYSIGTATYLRLPDREGTISYYRSPDMGSVIPLLLLTPFVDNSTYTTELRNGNINVLLETPYGSLSPVLQDPEKFFVKSNISSTFFALFFNVERLSREQRREVRRLVNARTVVQRFFRAGTPQQRDIVDYKGNRNNFADYVNRSIFPSSSYYVEEKIVEPRPEEGQSNLMILPDTVRVVASVNHGFREELTDLIEILNDPAVTRGRMRVRAAGNEEIRRGGYDAILLPITGYRSNFLFDLYNIFLREPDLESYRIALKTEPGPTGDLQPAPSSFRTDRNFFHLDPQTNSVEREDILQLLQYVYGFMATRQIGDKQEYARRVDELESRMALGTWLFSLPSLAYFSTQFDAASIDLYGVASQLSTVKKWREVKK